MDLQRSRKLPVEASVAGETRNDASPHRREAKRRRLLRPASVDKAGIADDSECSLRQIRENGKKYILEMMQEIQETAIQRDKASVFVRPLDCLRLVERDHTLEFKKTQIDGIYERFAIASWCWNSPEDKVVGGYFIKDKAGKRRRSERVRDSIWRRAAAYMRYEMIEYLWIDAECIDQEDSEATGRVMSEMDRLYHCGSNPFALLSRIVQGEKELHLLAQILTFQAGNEREFPLNKQPAIASGSEVVKLLDDITSDSWWTRAWIYQENYHGGEPMRLLMPHDIELESLKDMYRDIFGALEGELIISSIKFSAAVTKICSGFLNLPTLEDGEREAVHRILSRAARYSTLLDERSSMSPHIISDVVKRSVTVHADRLPIIANCCSYNMRLDISMLEDRGSSLSLAILVMFLLNGEIFRCDRDESQWDAVSPEASHLTVAQFIQRYAFKSFNPPFPRYGLSFNKNCRFVKAKIQADGVHTSGHLWKLCEEAIEIQFQRSNERDAVEKTLWRLQGYIRWRLREHRLADRLRTFIENLQKPSADEYMWTMCVKITDALHDGMKLRLGYLFDSSKHPTWSPPMAIFICPDGARDSHGPSFVFTSFRPGREISDGSGYTGDVDKHVSLQVGVNLTEGISPKLFARAWMHGLWFWTRPPQPVVFPLPSVFTRL